VAGREVDYPLDRCTLSIHHLEEATTRKTTNHPACDLLHSFPPVESVNTICVLNKIPARWAISIPTAAAEWTDADFPANLPEYLANECNDET
jgi:hypothetical protein